MQRTLMKKLAEWAGRPDRKPLILHGARQVGKTWLMRALGSECFDSTAYISFYNNSAAVALFEQDYDISRIIEGLQAISHTEIVPGKTLIVLDEIQNAPRALEALKYFSEDALPYAVIAAGSLLGVSIHQGVSFPVGKVEELRLYPLDFKEYLMALGEDRLAAALADFSDPLISAFHEKYEDMFKKYMVVGGMPEIVKAYADGASLEQVREMQNAILSQYEGDFGKHISPRELPRIRMTWNAVPMQLAKENKKFFFGQVKKGARMSDFEQAIEWLCDAGLLYRVHKVTKPALPLKPYTDFSAFKLFMVDVGLLGALGELDPDTVIYGDQSYVEFKGALSEQFVLQELVASDRYSLYYYSGEKSTYEIDFLIQRQGRVVPVEVKSSDNLKSKSLRAFCDRFEVGKAIRFSAANFRDQEWMMNIPLWAAGSV